MDFLTEHLIGAGLSGLAGQLRDITKEDAMRDYEALQQSNCKVNNDTLRVGNKAMDYFFFAHRLRTRTRRGISFPEWLKTDEKKKPYYAKLIAKTVKDGSSLIKAQYSAFSLYSGSGTISAFKPIIARRLYCMYDPKTILDFSAGWGGRCLGAMSLNINYIGFDTNTTLKSAYKGMIDMYPHTSKVAIHFQDSSKVDYSKYDYDMVFTSPPYFVKTAPTERYEKMPEYENKEDFNERFFFPVVRNTWEHLKSGGVYALNIPIEMYDDVKSVLGTADKKFQLQLPSRGKKEGRLGGGYKEYIYVWFKGGRGGSILPGSKSLPNPTFKNEYVEAKKSNIPNAGRGVFAKVDIPKGTRIADFEGKFMTYKDYNEKYTLPNGTVDRRYSYRMDNRSHQPGVIVAKDKPYLTKNIVNYINEGKPVNVELKKKGLYAKTDIDAGDELYLKYPKMYHRDWKE